MLLERTNSALLLVDVQEKLTPAVMNSERLIKNCRWLLELANVLNIPTVVSEQYSKGLGPTLATLNECIMSPTPYVDKVAFSLMRDEKGSKVIQNAHVHQWVLCGIETHVCILQTALDLLKEDYSVFVVVDAVSSRSQEDHQWGLSRMQQLGVQIITKEMFLFECLKQAGSSEFKLISQRFLQS